jgi:hypothetical protein
MSKSGWKCETHLKPEETKALIDAFKKDPNNLESMFKAIKAVQGREWTKMQIYSKLVREKLKPSLKSFNKTPF